MLSALAVMLPWRAVINFYLMVPTGLFLTACKLIWCYLLAVLITKLEWQRIPVMMLIVVIAIGASIPSARKFLIRARQHHVTGDVVEYLSQELQGIPEGELLIRMPKPCIEASHALSSFIKQPQLNQVLSTNDRFFKPGENVKPGIRYLLVTNGECREVP